MVGQTDRRSSGARCRRRSWPAHLRCISRICPPRLGSRARPVPPPGQPPPQVGNVASLEDRRTETPLAKSHFREIVVIFLRSRGKSPFLLLRLPPSRDRRPDSFLN